MEYKDILLALVTGGIGAAIVKGVFDLIAWSKKRKAEKEDRGEQNIEERLGTIEEKTDANSVALKFLLYDRIRFLGERYIRDNEIDLDDRRILKDMHDSYHNGLGGNGDLDLLMKQVEGLPLKIKK